MGVIFMNLRWKMFIQKTKNFYCLDWIVIGLIYIGANIYARRMKKKEKKKDTEKKTM